jgi:hypothetical protein
MDNKLLPHPDTVCKGIAKYDDIKPGVVLWHVYGHLWGEPQKVKILQIPQSYRNHRFAKGNPMGHSDFDLRSNWVYAREYDHHGRHSDCWRSLGDCGIGTNHNTNRLCLTREAAVKYHKAALAWNAENPDRFYDDPDDLDDFFDYYED